MVINFYTIKTKVNNAADLKAVAAEMKPGSLEPK